MIPYYILAIEKLDTKIEKYEIPYQIAIPGVQDKPPTIKYTKRKQQLISKFIKYDLVCETAHNQKGRAYYTNDIFEGFILIQEKVFYYSTCSNTIILSAPKEVFSNFVKIFSDDKAEYPLKVKKTEIDFLYIISNQLSKGIVGIWLGDYPDTNIDSLYVMGHKIENSEQYHNLIEEGATIRNLTILYNFNGNTEKIMITKDGGIVLYKVIDETEALMLVEDVYSKLFVNGK